MPLLLALGRRVDALTAALASTRTELRADVAEVRRDLPSQRPSAPTCTPWPSVWPASKAPCPASLAPARERHPGSGSRSAPGDDAGPTGRRPGVAPVGANREEAMSINTLEELRAVYQPPAARAGLKVMDHLDAHCRNFIACRPSTSSVLPALTGGRAASPRGDPPGSLAYVLDDKMLLLPDRPGNR